MPEVLSIRQISLEFSDLSLRSPISRPSQPLPRAPGIHQSDILRYIAVKIGKLKQGERLEYDYPWRMAMGNMWEEFYFSILVASGYTVWQPGEEIVDGVAVNADGVTLAGGVDIVSVGEASVLEETKCTEAKVFVSAEELLEAFSVKGTWWLYQHQVRGYCWCYGPRVVRWSVLHYRGDWQGSGPVAMEYVVRFSEEECRQTWVMQQKYKGEVEASIGIGRN